jgi:hypothetical protein
MGAVWSLLTSKLTGPIATAAALLFLVMFIDAKADGAAVAKGLRKELATVTQQRDDAKRDLTQCRTNEGNLRASVDRQGREITRLGDEGRARTEAAQREVDAARRSAAVANRRADQVLAATPGADQCASADALILGTVQ